MTSADTGSSIATAQVMVPARLGWIDGARGLGMLLVIAGHAAPKTLPPATAFQQWIYSFHIPLFFFLTGLLIKTDLHEIPWRKMVAKIARSLMLPYLFFGIISYLAWLIVLRHFGSDSQIAEPPLKILFGLVYGTFFSGLGAINATLWFFPCLFCSLLLYRGLPRNTAAAAVVVALLFCGGTAFAQMTTLRLPWCLDLAFVMVPFVYIGHKSRGRLLAINQKQIRWSLALVPFLLLVNYFCAFQNSMVSVALSRFGNPFLFFSGALCGSLAITLSAHWLPFRFLQNFLGRYTLIIFPLHLFVFSMIAAPVIFLPLMRAVIYSSPLATLAIYVVATCIVFIPIIPLLGVFLPWLVPEHKHRQPQR